MTVHIITTMPSTDPEHPLRLLCNNMLRSMELNVPGCNVRVIETGAEVSGDFDTPLYWRNTCQKFVEYKKYLEPFDPFQLGIMDIETMFLFVNILPPQSHDFARMQSANPGEGDDYSPFLTGTSL